MKNSISGIVPTDPIQRLEIRFIAGDRARRKAVDDFEVENNVVLLHGIDGDCAVEQLHVVVLEDNILLRDGFAQRVSLLSANTVVAIGDRNTHEKHADGKGDIGRSLRHVGLWDNDVSAVLEMMSAEK